MLSALRPLLIGRPALALGSTVLWGVIEFVALWRSRWLTHEPRD